MHPMKLGLILLCAAQWIVIIFMLAMPAPEPTFVAGTPFPVIVPVAVPFAVPGAPAAPIVPNEVLGAFSDPDGLFYCFPVEEAGF